jgi:hypothetical protein
VHISYLLYTTRTVLGELAQKFNIIPYNEATQAYVIDYKQVNTGNIKYTAINVASIGIIMSLTSPVISNYSMKSTSSCLVLLHTYV